MNSPRPTDLISQARALAEQVMLQEILIQMIEKGVVIPHGVTDEFPLVIEAQEEGNLHLKINNQPVVNVPQNCTLLLSSNRASGKVSLIVVAEPNQLEAALADFNKQDITARTSQSATTPKETSTESATTATTDGTP
jgi:hypothetical protein